MMPAGKYYVGDLCYVMHPEWSAVCDLVLGDGGCLEGEFNLPDGRRFAMYNTAWGDGQYGSSIGTSHCVDSGSIGCIRIDDITESERDFDEMNRLGAIVEFKNEFTTYTDDEGNLTFGHIVVETSDAAIDEYFEGEEQNA
jgi:hypothetical protein